MDWRHELTRVEGRTARTLAKAHGWPIGGVHPTKIALVFESAATWLAIHRVIRCLLSDWPKLAKEGNKKEMGDYLDRQFNHDSKARLAYRLELDPASGQLRSRLVAQSLADLLFVQWGMSVARNATHRQCAACAAWFEVHPAGGRPDKHFCSDACRMRAYRARKAARMTVT